MKKSLYYSLGLCTVLAGIIAYHMSSLGGQTPLAHAQSTTLSGLAWSSNIGWISFSGPGYGVSMDPATGNLSGEAWSDEVGWVQFGGLSGWPTGSGTIGNNAVVNLGAGTVTGWARACLGTVNLAPNQNLPGNCSSMNARTDGWDGWISMSGTGYGVTYNAQTGFSGYSWGGALGWFSWNFGNQTGQGCDPTKGVCSAGEGNPPLVTIAANPASVNAGQTSTLAWTVTNNPTSCSMSSSPSNTPNGSVASTSLGTVSGAINSPTRFSLTCTNANGSGSNTVYVSTSTTGGPGVGSGPVSMWLQNNVNDTNIHIHPSQSVALNWNTTQFMTDNTDYQAGTQACTETASGNSLPGSTWGSNKPLPAIQSQNGNPLVTLSSLPVGTYQLKIACRALNINTMTFNTVVSNNNSPVTITVTNSTIHEQ